MSEGSGIKRTVSFAPTDTFVEAFGEEEAKKQADDFVKETWMSNVTPKNGLPSQKPTPEEEEGVLSRNEMMVGFAVVAGIFLAGGLVTYLVLWKAGQLNGATGSSQ